MAKTPAKWAAKMQKNLEDLLKMESSYEQGLKEQWDAYNAKCGQNIKRATGELEPTTSNVVPINRANKTGTKSPTISLKNARVNFLQNVKAPATFSEMKLSQALNEIKTGKYKVIIEQVRKASSKAAYRSAKEKLPAYSFNGTFKDRVINDNLKESSGLFHFDIDELDAETIEKDKERIATIPSCVFCFISPSGRGLKGALRVDPGWIKRDADFKRIYSQVEAEFSELGLKLDRNCKDIRRVCFVSHDPAIYTNYNAQLFPFDTDASEAAAPAIASTPRVNTKTGSANTGAQCINIVTNKLLNAVDGDRHSERLKTAKLAGGMVAGGMVDEMEMLNALKKASDSISSGEQTTAAEWKTILDGFKTGKLEPITQLPWEMELDAHVEKFNETHAQVTMGGKHRIMRRIDNRVTRDGRVKYEFFSRNELSLIYDNTSIIVGEKLAFGAIKDIFANHIMAWAKHPNSKTYTGGIVFLPGAEAPETYFNTWQGFAVEPKKNTSLLKPVYYHLKFVICGGDKDLYNYVLKWIAFTFQNPDKPAGAAIIARGKKGSGKGTLGHFLKAIWGNHGLYINKAKHLVGDFNGHLADVCFVFADEAFYSGDKQHEGVLKSMVTDPDLMIERKGIDAVEQPNYLKLYMATNSEYAVPATEDERRWCVTDVSEKHIKDRDYFNKLQKACKSKEVQAAFLYDMLNLDLTGWHSGDIPESIGLMDQRFHSMEPHQKWLANSLINGSFDIANAERLTEASWSGKFSTEYLYSSYVYWCDVNKIDQYKRIDERGLSRYLKKLNYKKVNHVGGARNKRGYVLGELNNARRQFETQEKVKLEEASK